MRSSGRETKLITLADRFNKKEQEHANNFSPKQIKDINYIMQAKVSMINTKTIDKGRRYIQSRQYKYTPVKADRSLEMVYQYSSMIDRIQKKTHLLRIMFDHSVLVLQWYVELSFTTPMLRE